MVIYKPNRVDYVDLGVTLASMTSVTGQVRRFLYNGSQYVVAEYDTTTNEMELNYWNTNGTAASSCLMEYTGILDVYFDSADDRFYALRWNNSDGYCGSPGKLLTSPVVFYDDFAWGNPNNTWKVSPEFWLTTSPSWSTYTTHTHDGTTETSVLDTAGWTIFRRNPRTDMLEFRSTVGRGMIRSTAVMHGDFDSQVTCFMTMFPSATSSFAVRMIDVTPVFTTYEKNNLMVQTFFFGKYDPPGLDYGTWWSAHVYFANDNTSNKWAVTNFRLIEKFIDVGEFGLDTYKGTTGYTIYQILFDTYSYAGGIHKHTFSFTRTTPAPTIDLVGGMVTSSAYSFDFVAGAFAFTLVVPTTVDLNTAHILDGTSIEIYININSPSVGDATLSTVDGTVNGFYMGVFRSGTTLYSRRDVDGPGATAWQNIRSYNLTPSTYDPDLSIELCAAAVGEATLPTLEVDNVLVTSTADVTYPTIPSISVETYDTSGTRNYISGTTDSDGFAIKKLNVINYNTSDGGSISDILSNGGIFAITTDNLTEADGGSVYIATSRSNKETPRVFKYKKSSFPLSDAEYGQNAYITSSGTIDFSSRYRIGTFGYSSTCVSGELSYITDNWNDYRRGYYLSTLNSGTMSGTLPRRRAWLQNLDDDYFAWSITDPSALYGITASGTYAGKIRLYNMNPDTPAFCNIVSENRMLAAGTSETSDVTAKVMNVYGVPLSGKSVSFSITSGDGSLSPATDTTDVNGEASTTYTVGTAVTTSVVTATVSI